MRSRRCHEPLPPLQPQELGKRNSLRRHEKRQKLMLGDKGTPCDRRWEEMNHELLICIMKRIRWYEWNRLDFIICKSWLSALLDSLFPPLHDDLFPPGYVLDLRLLDNHDFRSGCRWTMRRFFHCLKLNLDRYSPNHYTKLILCECILPYQAYHDIAKRLPSLKSFVSPAKMDFYCEHAKRSYGTVWAAEGHTQHYGFVVDAMCGYWKNLEDAHCHISMIPSLAIFGKSIRNLTVIGITSSGPVSWVPIPVALPIGNGFPFLDRLSFTSHRLTLQGMSMILEGHKNLTYLDMEHTECVPKEPRITPLSPVEWNCSSPEDLRRQIARVQSFLTWNGKNCPECTHFYSIGDPLEFLKEP